MAYWSNYGYLIESLFELVHSRHATPPDHRPRDRPMEILALGISRSGTDSLMVALKELGYNETYHGFTATAQPSDFVLFRQAYNAKFAGRGKPLRGDDWDKLYGNCMAVSDLLAAMFAPELLAAYPEAKVILTEREVEGWYRSIETSGEPLMRSRWAMFVWHFQWELWEQLVFIDLYKTFVRGDFRKFGNAAYVEHNAMIKKMVPREKLLVYHVSQGWEPLCEFLGKPVPKREMPRGNDSKAFAETMGRLTGHRVQAAFRNAILFLGFMVAFLATSVALLVRYFT